LTTFVLVWLRRIVGQSLVKSGELVYAAFARIIGSVAADRIARHQLRQVESRIARLEAASFRSSGTTNLIPS
jgi:predicted transcriptional regulator